MPLNPNQNVQQAKLVTGTELRPGQVPVQLELFTTDGIPWNPEGAEPVDLSGYATTDYVDNAIPDVSNFVTQAQVDDAIAAAIADLGE